MLTQTAMSRIRVNINPPIPLDNLTNPLCFLQAGHGFIITGQNSFSLHNMIYPLVLPPGVEPGRSMSTGFKPADWAFRLWEQ